MVTNGDHEFARRGDCASRQRRNRERAAQLTGACMARVKFGKLLLLVCTFCVSASAELLASTDSPPPADHILRLFHQPRRHAAVGRRDRHRSRTRTAIRSTRSTSPRASDVSRTSRWISRRSAARALARRAVQRGRLGGARQRPADSVLRQPDLAGEQLQHQDRSAAPARRALRSSCRKTAVEFGLINPFEPIHALNVAGKFAA